MLLYFINRRKKLKKGEKEKQKQKKIQISEKRGKEAKNVKEKTQKRFFFKINFHKGNIEEEKEEVKKIL